MTAVLDFHITPGKGKDGMFNLEVFGRGKGKGKKSTNSHSQPLVKSSFKMDVSFLTDYEVSRLEFGLPGSESETLQRRRAFGAKLYEALFVPVVENTWRAAKEKNDFLVCRLRIAKEAEKLEVLPWECLFDGTEFIAAGSRTGLVRLPLDIPLPKDPPALDWPFRMLALVSSPLDLEDSERLAVEKEQDTLLRATQSPASLGRLKIDFEDECKLTVIESSLDIPYQLLHYSGHGIDPKSGGGLLLEDVNGKKRFTPVEEVLQSLEKGITHFRLVVLSGCQTARTLYSSGFQDLARALVRRKVPAVIAMQFSITDEGGLLFAESLYPRLLEGKSIEEAVSAARRVLLHSDKAHIRADALAPVLFLAASQPLRARDTGEEPAAKRPPQVNPIEFEHFLALPRLNFGFYGRRREYRAIRDGLLYKNQRAIIIHGIGGIGKTALVSHVASRLKNNFHGIHAFDCRAGVLAPETIVLDLHRRLKAMKIDALQQLLHRSFPPEELAVYLGQVLGQVRLLIIFDNFETHLELQEGKHIIAEPGLRGFLEMLVKTTGQGSCFLFTSRYLFDIDEKRLGLIRFIPLDDLSRPEALGMMRNLPHLSGYGYEEQEEALAVFGGHPYSLVTLDRHCGMKSLVEALADAKEVRRELREFLAIEINYEKLSEKGRDLLNRLAAFRRPVGWEALYWVLGKPVDVAEEFLKQIQREKLPEKFKSMSDEELLSLLREELPERRQRVEGLDALVRELVSWGLVTPVARDGTTDFVAVHGLVRDFCREKCQDTWTMFLRDAAAYYTEPSKRMPMEKKDEYTVFAEIEGAELLMEAGEYEQAASIIINVTPLLKRWGLGRYSESLYNRLIPVVNQETQAGLIHDLAVLLQDRGDYKLAKNYLEKSLEIKKKFGDLSGVAKSEHVIGTIYLLTGKPQQALIQYQKALRIAEDIGYQDQISMALFQIGRVHQVRGEYELALENFEKSMEVSKRLDDLTGVAQTLHQIGRIHEAQGENGLALELYEQSLEIFEKLGYHAGVAKSLSQIGVILHQAGEYEATIECYEQSLEIFEKLDYREEIARSKNQLGLLFMGTKKFSEALEHLLMALTIFAELQSPYAGTAIRNLSKLRSQWGEREFDAAWKEKTGEEVPDVLKRDPAPEQPVQQNQPQAGTGVEATEK